MQPNASLTSSSIPCFENCPISDAHAVAAGGTVGTSALAVGSPALHPSCPELRAQGQPHFIAPLGSVVIPSRLER